MWRALARPYADVLIHTGTALGTALGDVLGTALGDALGDALGTALGTARRTIPAPHRTALGDVLAMS